MAGRRRRLIKGFSGIGKQVVRGHVGFLKVTMGGVRAFLSQS
nr:C898 [uncultured bacterium]